MYCADAAISSIYHDDGAIKKMHGRGRQWDPQGAAGLNSDALLSRYRTLFPYKSGSRPSFLRHTQRSRIQKLGLFQGPQKILRASEAGKKK